MGDEVIPYKCTSCYYAGEREANALAVEGCQDCGCKRLELWTERHGHHIHDWRSQKSVRKNKRQHAARSLA